MDLDNVISVHTPSSSLALFHSVTADSLTSLFKKLTRKQYSGKRVGPGWLKYRWSGIVWNLDNNEDYTIFQWRKNGSTDPTIYLKDPSEPLPSQSLYRNRSFYLFHPDHTVPVQPSLDIQTATLTFMIDQQIEKELPSLRVVVEKFIKNPDPPTPDYDTE